MKRMIEFVKAFVRIQKIARGESIAYICSMAWRSSRDAVTDWAEYERAVLLACGSIHPLNRHDRKIKRRMRRIIEREAKGMAERETWFALSSRVGRYRHRLNGFISMTERRGYDALIVPAVARERRMVAAAEIACDMRKRAEDRMSVNDAK